MRNKCEKKGIKTDYIFKMYNNYKNKMCRLFKNDKFLMLYKYFAANLDFIL